MAVRPVLRRDALGRVCRSASSARTPFAVYRDLIARGVAASRPFVGIGLSVTPVTDPEAYELFFESLTDVPEETVYSE